MEKAEKPHNLFELDQRQVDRVMIPCDQMHAIDLSASADESLPLMRETEKFRVRVLLIEDHRVGRVALECPAPTDIESGSRKRILSEAPEGH